MSVVIPVFNQGEFVAGAIRSVLAQGYRPLELIVVDDGSTDATPERIGKFEDRVTVLTQPNRGASVALNRGIRASHGQYVCWLSADDEFLDGKIEAQVRAFDRNPEIGLVHTGYEVVDGDDNLIRTIQMPSGVHPDPFITVFWRNSINGSTVMLRRDVFDASGGFDESLQADVDADMWLRIAQDSRLLGIPGVYVRYRVHGNTISANTALMTASMTGVRRRYINELRQRVTGGSGSAPVLLAAMSADFAAQGLDALASDLLRESRSAGLAPRTQLRALAAIQVTRARRRRLLRVLGRPFWRGIRRLRGIA